MLPLTKKQERKYKKQKIYHKCKQEFNDMFSEDENYHRVRDHCHYPGKYWCRAQSIYNMRYNSSNCDCYFIIKELAKEFKGQFQCLRENTEKYINFSVPIQQQKENDKKITYKMKFIDSVRFMTSLLSSLADNLAERLHNGKCENCESGLDYAAVEDNTLTFRCLHCNRNYEKKFDKGLAKRFQNTCRLSDVDINKFCLILSKVVYPCEYMYSWERFSETSLPERKYFTAI